MELFSPQSYNLVPRFSIKEFNQREFNNIYNTGQVRNIDPGKSVFDAIDASETIVLILKGAVMILRELDNHLEEMGILREGDWLGDLDIFKKPYEIFSVVTMEPSTVLTLTKTSYASLNPNLQYLILTYINYFYLQVTNWLGNGQMRLTMANRYLTDVVHHRVLQQGHKYADSKIISSILKNVPRLPPYVNTLLTVLSDAEASSREISNLAKDDPSLVGEILKTVNSSYFGLRSKISDFHHAIMLLGFNQVRQLVIANGLRKTMPDTPEFRALHDHCVTVSHLAFALAKHGLRHDAPTVATIGLLHGIGESVILLMKRHSPEWSVLIEALDPAKLGAMLLREWNIPAEVHTVIEFQNHPLYMPLSEIPIDKKEALAVLHIAHLCYDSIQDNGESRAHHPFVHSYLQLANLPHYSIQDVVENMLFPLFADERQTVAQHVKDFLLGAKKGGKASQTTSS